MMMSTMITKEEDVDERNIHSSSVTSVSMASAAAAAFGNSVIQDVDVRNLGLQLSSNDIDSGGGGGASMVVVHSSTNHQQMMIGGHGGGKLMPQLTAESIGHDLSLNLNNDLDGQFNNEKIEIDVDPNQHGYCNDDDDDAKLHSITDDQLHLPGHTAEDNIVINDNLGNIANNNDDDEHRPLKKRRLSRRKVTKSNSSQLGYLPGMAGTSGGRGGGGSGTKSKQQTSQELGRLKRNNVKLLKYQTILKNLVDILSQMNTCLGDKLYNVVTGKSVQNIPIYKLLEYIQPFLPLDQTKEDSFLPSFALLFEQYKLTMSEKNKAEETLPQDQVYNYYQKDFGMLGSHHMKSSLGHQLINNDGNDELNIANSFADYEDEDDGVMLEDDLNDLDDDDEDVPEVDDDDEEWEANDTSYSPKGKKATPKKATKASGGGGPGRKASTKSNSKSKAGTSSGSGSTGAAVSAAAPGGAKKRRPRARKKKNENGEPDNRNVSLFCPWPNCTYETKREWALNEHINLTHTGLKQFNCKVEDCQLNFYTSAELDLHMKKAHSDIASKEFMSCTWPGCNALFKSKLGLRGHLRIHKGEDMIACDWPGCNYTAKNKRQSENHQRKHTGDRPFSCGYEGCDASFRTNDSLRHHRKCHSEYRPFWCDWPGCDANFKTNRGLTLHRALHTGEKLFKCDRPDCDFASERKYHVDLHIYESHTHIKPYQCNWTGCDASFLRNDKLQNHLKIHRQEKPFKCIDPGCDKHFVEKGNMMKHFNNVHKRT